MKKKVLIIDNDLNVCREIKYALQNATTDAYYACSVSDGIKHFMEQEYCLLIWILLWQKQMGRNY